MESDSSESEEENWSDWNDESIGITCLFCNYDNNEFTCILNHMKETHNFDFEENVKDLTFYQKVKNYNMSAVNSIFLTIFFVTYQIIGKSS